MSGAPTYSSGLCAQCDPTVHGRLKAVARDRKIVSGMSLIRDAYWQQVSGHFPDLLDDLRHPETWLSGRIYPLLDLARLPPSVRFHFEVVLAPLPQAAYITRIPCACGLEHHVLTLNVCFNALATHLLAASSNRMRPPPADTIRELVRRQRSEDPGSFHRLPHPLFYDEHGITEFVWGGIAWVMLHEIGHIAGTLRIEAPDSFGVLRKYYEPELTADVCGMGALRQRLIAHRRDPAALFGGVELVLRTAAAIGGLGEGRLARWDEAQTPRSLHPPPAYRWSVLYDWIHTALDLGLAPSLTIDDYEQLRELAFGRWDDVIDLVNDETGGGLPR